MKTLIIIRHGHYDADLQLDDTGRAKMTDLSIQLISHLVGEVRLLTSAADRALQSAEILADSWDISAEANDALWSDNDHPVDLPELLKLVRDNGDADTLLLLTHLEYVRDFPHYYGEHALGVGITYSPIGKGEACVIDCVRRTVEYVR